MSEILEAGYSDLRTHVESVWSYIGLFSPGDVEHIRLGISDIRAQWVHSPGDQVLKYQVDITGEDVDVGGVGGVALPKTFGKAKLFKVSSGGSPLASETFSSFTIANVGDQMRVVFSLEVPVL